MSARLATRRLIDAAATLPPADRALLNLWTQRGLDGEALARMTGVDPGTIEARRTRIVSHLSTELGLPPEDVSSALSSIAESAAATRAASAAESESESQSAAESESESATESQSAAAPPAAVNGGADPVPSAAETVAAVPATPATSPEASVEPAGADSAARPQTQGNVESPGPRRRRMLWGAVALLALVVIAVALVTDSSGGDRAAPSSVVSASPPTTPVSSATATASSATSGATPAPAASAAPRTLVPLPGGLPGASGVITLARASSTQSVRVRTHGLQAPGRAHYEVWLYNSIIDSRALGALPPGGSAKFGLPADAGRFAWIDISRQGPGTTEPSGASVLRAPNPLAGVAP